MEQNRKWEAEHGYDEISQLLYVDEEGVVRWKVARANNKIKPGDVFGSRMETDRLYYRHGQLTLGGEERRVFAHRIAYLLYHRCWPKNQIDHIDHNGENNKFGNLRDVDNQTNGRNQRRRLDNTSGYCGVYWCARDKVWYARIKVNNKLSHLGLFKNKNHAIFMRQSANYLYGFSPRHGAVD